VGNLVMTGDCARGGGGLTVTTLPVKTAGGGTHGQALIRFNRRSGILVQTLI
jgi:hypothetical protein